MPVEEPKNSSPSSKEDPIRASLERNLAMMVVNIRQESADYRQPREEKKIDYRPKKEGGIYTRETIQRFADEAVKFTDDTNEADAKRMKDMYVRVLSRIPEWQQELVMESGRPIVLGSPESINKLSRKESATYRTNGFFTPSDNKVHASVYGDTLSHEKGHQFDYGGKEKGYFSESTTEWKQALAREQATGWRGEKAIDEAFEHIPSSQYGIRHHLNQGYKPEQFAKEAMAEMTAIYNRVYIEYNYSGGLVNGIDEVTKLNRRKESIEKANAVMEKAYPDLFPVYRDEFIPHAVKKASELSKANDIEEKKIFPKQVAKAGKLLSVMIPTNYDNLYIAGAAGIITRAWSMLSGESYLQASKTANETTLEISGIAAAQRSWKAGREGDIKESAIQAVDALGIPVVAASEGIVGARKRIEVVKNEIYNQPRLDDSCGAAGMASMTHTVSKPGNITKPVFPEAVTDAKLMEKIAQKLKKNGMMCKTLDLI